MSKRLGFRVATPRPREPERPCPFSCLIGNLIVAACVAALALLIFSWLHWMP